MSALIRPMFPPTVDSTILSTFRACPQKFFRQYVEHWKPRAQSVHLIAGGAFASGIEAAREAFYVKGLPPADAEASGLTALIRHYGDFQCPADSAKSLERMCGALEFYFSMYPLGADGATPIVFADGRHGIEFSFAEPLDTVHPVTGDPILYTGRSDMIASRAGGTYVYDEKTTSSLGGQWARQWEMRSQFTGYIWAAAQQGIKINGAMWESGYWDYSLDGACTEYGGCSFQKVCKSSEPEAWLPVEFEQSVWDPLAKRRLSVAEYEASWGYVREGAPAPDLPSQGLPMEGVEDLLAQL